MLTDMLIMFGCFAIGAIVTSILFVINDNTYKDGYNAGYKQSQKEQADRFTAGLQARWNTEQQINRTVKMVQGWGGKS